MPISHTIAISLPGPAQQGSFAISGVRNRGLECFCEECPATTLAHNYPSPIMNAEIKLLVSCKPFLTMCNAIFSVSFFTAGPPRFLRCESLLSDMLRTRRRNDPGRLRGRPSGGLGAQLIPVPALISPRELQELGSGVSVTTDRGCIGSNIKPHTHSPGPLLTIPSAHPTSTSSLPLHQARGRVRGPDAGSGAWLPQHQRDAYRVFNSL